MFFRARCPAGRGGGTGRIDRRPARPPTCSSGTKNLRHARLVQSSKAKMLVEWAGTSSGNRCRNSKAARGACS